MPKKFMSCVNQVKKKHIGNPYAICRVSTGFYGSTRHHSRKMKGGLFK